MFTLGHANWFFWSDVAVVDHILTWYVVDLCQRWTVSAPPVFLPARSERTAGSGDVLALPVLASSALCAAPTDFTENTGETSVINLDRSSLAVMPWLADVKQLLCGRPWRRGSHYRPGLRLTGLSQRVVSTVQSAKVASTRSLISYKG